jgi:hypothetical protein
MLTGATGEPMVITEAPGFIGNITATLSGKLVVPVM